jgi:hypothetical protein
MKAIRGQKSGARAATRAAWAAQGRYLGAIRQLSKAARKQIKAIREKSSVAAAIRRAKKLAR